MAAYDQELISPGAIYLSNGVYSSKDDRQVAGDLGGGGTLDYGTDFLPIAAGSGLNVNVAGGIAYVWARSPLGGPNYGSYRVFGSAGSYQVTCGTAHATLPRLDQIVLRVMEDDYDGSGFIETRVEVYPGTPTSGATFANRNGAATLFSMAELSDSIYLLADVIVQAAATVLTSTDIKDRRVPLHSKRRLWKVGSGVSVFPILSDIAQGLEIQVPMNSDLPQERAVEVLYTLEETPLSLPDQYWKLLYVNQSAGQQWDFMGGAELFAEVVTSQTTTSASYVDLTTAGPSITVPLAGLYEISFGADLNTSVAGTQTIMAAKIGAAATADTEGVESRNANRTGVMRTIRRTCAAGDLIKCQYKSNGTATLTAQNRWLKIKPIYVA